MTVATRPPVDVVAAKILIGTIVRLTFSDGFIRTVDLRPLMRGPVFDEIFESNMFRELSVEPEAGTITWPNGADLSPDTLRYSSPITRASVTKVQYILSSKFSRPRERGRVRTGVRAARSFARDEQWVEGRIHGLNRTIVREVHYEDSAIPFARSAD